MMKFQMVSGNVLRADSTVEWDDITKCTAQDISTHDIRFLQNYVTYFVDY